MLTGSIQGTRNAVKSYLEKFKKYEWMWKQDKDIAYKKFLSRKPTIDAYEFELKRFVEVEDDIAGEPPLHVIGSLTLNTNNLKLQLKHEASMWKVQYSDNLHIQSNPREDIKLSPKYLDHGAILCQKSCSYTPEQSLGDDRHICHRG